MKKLISYFDYFPDIFLLIVAFFLPVFPAMSQVGIGLFLIFWIAKGQYKYLYKIKEHSFVLGCIGIFAVYFLSGLYSENLQLWGSGLEAKLPLLIVPILLLSREKYDQKVVKGVLWAFALGCLSLMIYLQWQHFLRPKNTFRFIIVEKTVMNTIYLAMYFSFIVLFGFVMYYKKIIQFSFKSFLLLVVLFWFHYAIYAFESRMAILSLTFIELGIFFVWKVLLERKILQAGIMIFFLVTLNFLSLNLGQYPTNRMKSLVKQRDVRELIWKGSWIQIIKSPIIGHGSGDTQDLLIEAYKTLDYNIGIEKKQNCHNQYLQLLMTAGIIGLLVLLVWLFLSFRTAWFNQNYLFCILIAIFALNMLTESMLERQQGTYFIAFFGSLLLWKNSEKRKNNQP